MTELRADARRNREELLDVAREVIREQGVDASLRDIVGKGAHRPFLAQRRSTVT